MATEEEPNCLHEDPLAEAVFNNLDADDKKEFGDFGEAIKTEKSDCQAKSKRRKASPGLW